MTIEEAIRARLDRFNRLWLAAEGHTFEDDPSVKRKKYEEDIKEWNEKMQKRCEKLGFHSEDDYYWYMLDKKHDNPDFKIDEEIANLWHTKPNYDSLYDYEILCINEGRKIAEFVTNLDGDTHKNWEELCGGENSSLWTLVENIKKKGCDLDDGHSGNSMGMSVLFANSLLFNRDIFPYLHGALAPLVGDKGYHDDRKDIPKELFKKDE